MSYEEQDVIWRVALASYDPREMRVWTRYLEERNPAIRCTGSVSYTHLTLPTKRIV